LTVLGERQIENYHPISRLALAPVNRIPPSTEPG